MIDILALVLSTISLTACAVLLWRDAKRWKIAEDPTLPQRKSIATRIEAVIKRHQYSTEPGHRTSVAYVKDIIQAAERESAKPRFVK